MAHRDSLQLPRRGDFFFVFCFLVVFFSLGGEVARADMGDRSGIGVHDVKLTKNQ